MPVFPPRRRATSDPYRDQIHPQFLSPQPYGQPVYPMMMPQHLSPHFAPVPLSPGQQYYAWPPGPAYPSPQYWPGEVEAKNMAVQLHPLLARAQLRLLYDCRFKPDKSYVATSTRAPYKLPEEVATSPATNPMVPKIRLVTKALPWAVTVKSEDGITIGELLQAIYDALDQPLTEGEWWIAPESERARVLEAYKHNCSESDGTPRRRKLEEGVKRVDWLGKKTMVTGVTRPAPDDALVKSRFPAKAAQAEAWILELGDS